MAKKPVIKNPRIEIEFNEESGLYEVILYFRDTSSTCVAMHCEEDEAKESADAIIRFASEC